MKTKFEQAFESYINTPVKPNDEYLLKHKDHLKSFYSLEESILNHGAKIGFELGASYERERALILIKGLEFYANHESVIKEAYHSNDKGQITCIHTFINHKAKEALAAYESEK